MSRDIFRVTLDFNPAVKAKIDELKEATSCSTTAEFFKSALNVFAFFLEEITIKGGQLLIVKPDGEERIVLLPGLRSNLEIIRKDRKE